MKKIIFLFAIIVFVLFIGCFNSTEVNQEAPVVRLNDTTARAAIDLKDTECKTEGKNVPTHIPLKLIVTHLASSTAPVIVGVYKSKYKFLSKESRLKEYKFIPEGNTLTCYITDIEYSEIAVAVYQDMNSNSCFDKNFIGLPKEGYAFSNNFKPTVKAPDYNDCKFNYDSINAIVSMILIK